MREEYWRLIKEVSTHWELGAELRLKEAMVSVFGAETIRHQHTEFCHQKEGRTDIDWMKHKSHMAVHNDGGFKTFFRSSTIRTFLIEWHRLTLHETAVKNASVNVASLVTLKTYAAPG